MCLAYSSGSQSALWVSASLPVPHDRNLAKVSRSPEVIPSFFFGEENGNAGRRFFFNSLQMLYPPQGLK